MAPRSKRPKKGLRRMDAALDAMALLGFKDQVVRKSVKDLLKVYGDEGWVFIEEAAYKLLIETILEKQAEESDDDHVEPQPQIQLAAETSCSNEIISTNFQENNQELVDKEVCEEHVPADNVTPVKLCEQEKCDENDIDTGNGPLLLKSSLQDLAPLHSTPPKDTVQSNRIRKPCYGWISDDSDEDEKDFVSLHAAKQVNKV